MTALDLAPRRLLRRTPARLERKLLSPRLDLCSVPDRCGTQTHDWLGEVVALGPSARLRCRNTEHLRNLRQADEIELARQCVNVFASML
jgi:hypothetical protein